MMRKVTVRDNESKVIFKKESKDIVLVKADVHEVRLNMEQFKKIYEEMSLDNEI